MTALLLAALSGAYAFDRPVLWVKEGVGVAGWSSGLISDTKVQVRAPLYRSDSIVFQDTYAGVGGRFAVTPAFVDVGPRLSLAPIDIFDVDVQASWHGYFGTSSSLMPYDVPAGKLQSDRTARKDEAYPGMSLSISAAPTLKLALGPIVAFDAWTFERWHVPKPEGETAPFVYEPYRDMVIAWDDTLIQQQAAVLGKLMEGDDGPLVWVGATVRDQRSLGARDRSTAVGGVAMWRPGKEFRAPTLLLQVLPYLIDADRVGMMPNIQGQIAFTHESPLRAVKN